MDKSTEHQILTWETNITYKMLIECNKQEVDHVKQSYEAVVSSKLSITHKPTCSLNNLITVIVVTLLVSHCVQT